MSKLTIMCFLLSHGPSAPIDILDGTPRNQPAQHIVGTLLTAPELTYDWWTGRYELAHHVDRIALHDECRK